MHSVAFFWVLWKCKFWFHSFPNKLCSARGIKTDAEFAMSFFDAARMQSFLSFTLKSSSKPKIMFNAFHTNSCLLGKTILFKSYAKGIVSADFKCLALNFHKFVYAVNVQADLVITTIVLFFETPCLTPPSPSLYICCKPVPCYFRIAFLTFNLKVVVGLRNSFQSN